MTSLRDPRALLPALWPLSSTVRQVLALQVGSLATAVIGFVGSALLARLLGSADFGLYALALSVVSLLGIFTDLGQAIGAVTYWSRAAAEGTIDRAARVGAYLVRVSLLGNGLLLLLAIPLAPLFVFPLYGEPRLAPLLLLLLLGRLANVGLRLVTTAFQATRRVTLLTALETVDLALRSGLSVVATLIGLAALGAVLGQLLGGLLAALASLVLYARVASSPPELPPAGQLARLALQGALPGRELLGFGISVVLERHLRVVAASAPLLLLGALASATEVGNLRVALAYMAVPALLYEPLARVLMVLFPQLGVRNQSALGGAYWRGTAVSTTLTLVVAVPLTLLAPLLIPLVYGADYRAAVDVTPFLGLAAAAGALNATSVPLLRALNRVLPAVLLGALVLALAAPLVWWLIAQRGLAGAAAATAVAALLPALTTQWVALRALREQRAQHRSSRA